jgi:hypothetical protein
MVYYSNKDSHFDEKFSGDRRCKSSKARVKERHPVAHLVRQEIPQKVHRLLKLD